MIVLADVYRRVHEELRRALGRAIDGVGDDADLVTSGVLDSMAWFDLTDGLCQIFGLPDGALDVLAPGRRSVAALAAAIDRALGSDRVTEAAVPYASSRPEPSQSDGVSRADMHITGWGLVVPEGRVDGGAFAERAGISTEELERRTGVLTRAAARDASEVERMAIDAATRALAVARRGPDRVGAVIVTSESLLPSIPGFAWTVHDRLGFGTATFPLDLPAGCAGLTPALQVASALIGGSSIDSVLLIAVEAPIGLGMVDHLPWELGALLGDGAAALVLERRQEGSRGLSVRRIVHRVMSDRRELLGAELRRKERAGALYIDVRFAGDAVARVALEVVPEVFDDLLGQVGWDRASLSRVGVHQPNGRLAERLRERLRLSADVAPNQVGRWGNLGSVSALSGLLDGLELDAAAPGSRFALVTVGAGVCAGAVALVLR